MSTWHIIVSGYPPQPGGVSDYTLEVAKGLAASGDEVHVWCPPTDGEHPDVQGVTVHRELGRFSLSDLRKAGKLLDGFAGAKRLLVQWVPHAYGYKAMNIFICLWLWGRSRLHRDDLEIMVHEPYLAFGQKRLKQKVQALVQRLMTVILVNAAGRIWVSIPAWEDCWRKYTLGRRVPFGCLPVPSNVPLFSDEAMAENVRSRFHPQGGTLLGHFGTYYPQITEVLESVVPQVLSGDSKKAMLLLGRGSVEFRESLCLKHPELTKRVHATGELKPRDISGYIKACDVMLQPYHDGITTRRTSVMASLAHGRPIVTTFGHLTESFWAESDAVALCPVGDESALVTTTCRLLADATERELLGRLAHSLYGARFDLKHTIASLRGCHRSKGRAEMSIQYAHSKSDGGA